ncbi:MAG: DUF4402 domain-containing protein [Bacteroidota bacterium]|nr:DUF4402 domain-containing protein [Bacteroidota bacterium]MDP4233319.1 DUF4402 domain-containing protein [Bacteroidota bacterium]MDP4242061.1 DUF4402 domain-containing protein [Bacteroidota bacterium]MDP4288661.1 DUF4402 domain-containing protein [Bacteroidota bacterium]
MKSLKELLEYAQHALLLIACVSAFLGSIIVASVSLSGAQSLSDRLTDTSLRSRVKASTPVPALSPQPTQSNTVVVNVAPRSSRNSQVTVPNHSGASAGSTGNGFQANSHLASTSTAMEGNTIAGMKSQLSSIGTTRSNSFSNGRIRITPIRDLNFGVGVIGAGGGTITTTPAGVSSCTGAVILEPTSNATAGAFQFSIAGDEDEEDPWVDNGHGRARRHNHHRNGSRNADSDQQDGSLQILSIMMPDHAVLTRVGGSGTYTADHFTYAIDRETVYVGATLHVTQSQISGPFAGSYYLTLILE